MITNYDWLTIFFCTYYNSDPSTALPMKHSVHSYSDSVSAFSDTATLLIPIWYNVPDFIILATAFATLLTPTRYPLFRYTATFLTLNQYLVLDDSIFITAFTKSAIPTSRTLPRTPTI